MIRRRLAPLAAALLAASTSALAGCAREASVESLVLVSLDTVRADHLGLHGHEHDTSPRLDAFARQGVVFENAWSTAPWTLPAHVSLFTGLYPSRHGVRYEEHALEAGVPALAEILAEAGFATGAVVNCIFLYPRFGVARGYDVYERIDEEHGAEGAASEVTDAALRFLRAHRGERVFLFVHYFDVHSDYRSRPEIEARFGGRPTWVDGSTQQLIRALIGTVPIDDPEEIAALEALYDAGIRQLDEELGRLFTALADEGWLDDTAVVVTSDHGEELLDHGSVMHGATQYEEQLRVPLVLRAPGVPAGARVAQPVSLVDVLPTALDLLGGEPPPGLDGISLVGAWERPLPERPLFAEANRSPKPGSRVAVRRGPHKLLLDLETGDRALYDLAADPGETDDRIEADPAQAEALLEAYETFRQVQVDGVAIGEVPDDLRERLRALGYEDEAGPLRVPDRYR